MSLEARLIELEREGRAARREGRLAAGGGG
ncbi:hypothetical protein [Sorangium cellulosum]|nr:hypothetical protein [Sorangium cellulosum]